MKREEQQRSSIFTRRTVVIAGLKTALLSAIGARLYALQIVDGQRYQTRSEENRIATRLLVPQRGLITDRDGSTLAMNVPGFEVYLTEERSKDIATTVDRLAQFLRLSEAEILDLNERIEKEVSFVPVLVKRNLTLNQAMVIDSHLPELPGSEVREIPQRFYPDKDAFAHVVGYVGSVTREDIDRNSARLLRMPNFKIGKLGIEGRHDQTLVGQSGSRQIEVNAGGRPLRELSRQPATAGRNVAVSLSRDLQLLSQKLLANHRAGSAVLMDARSGEVLACASHPSYDPNSFVRGFSRADWKALQDNPDRPQINRALRGRYAPGSTYKMIIMLAAMKAGISTSAQVSCSGYIDVSNQRFHCWKRAGHGVVNMPQSLVNSCDVYYYELAQRLGIERMNAVAREFGFGNAVSLDFQGFENGGLLPTREWKRDRIGFSWDVGDSIQVSIGQGYLLATPMQLATMTARLATGLKVVPHFGLGRQKEFDPLSFDPYHLRVVRQSMHDVVNSDDGTARSSKINHPKFSMSGKTGTAQVRRISQRERDTAVLTNEELDYLERDHSLFVGYGPVKNPRYAVSVIVEHGGSGSAVAAPLARDLLSAAQLRFGT